ncbi:MAG: DUF4082 domain-containing protein, partial [Actinomycetota bacterium]|nr:DUF4082 domain-containing protein [Actinomycetota bacterium]
LYVVSYHAQTRYSVSNTYFTGSVVTGTLTAPSSASAGGNGVFGYGSSGTFPTASYDASNYFVDVIASVPAQPTTLTLFQPSDTPAVVNSSDGGPLELGVKFRTTAAGASALGVKFYKGSLNTGTHVAHLWTTAGTLLATATFTGETASGWQTVNFASSVALTPNTTYIASYHTTAKYSATINGFVNARVNGTLSAPSSASSGGNGVFSYGPSGSFPTATYSATNYLVDVIVQSL